MSFWEQKIFQDVSVPTSTLVPGFYGIIWPRLKNLGLNFSLVSIFLGKKRGIFPCF
jgi:hypothetical protein